MSRRPPLGSCGDRTSSGPAAWRAKSETSTVRARARRGRSGSGLGGMERQPRPGDRGRRGAGHLIALLASRTPGAAPQSSVGQGATPREPSRSRADRPDHHLDQLSSGRARVRRRDRRRTRSARARRGSLAASQSVTPFASSTSHDRPAGAYSPYPGGTSSSKSRAAWGHKAGLAARSRGNEERQRRHPFGLYPVSLPVRGRRGAAGQRPRRPRRRTRPR